MHERSADLRGGVDEELGARVEALELLAREAVGEALVRVVGVDQTLELVAAGLGDAVEDDAGEAAVLGGGAEADELDLFDDVVVDERPGGAALRVRSVDPVELIGEAGAGGAVGDVVVDAGRQVQDVGLEAAGRQVLEVIAVEVGVGRRARRVDGGGVRGHDQGLGDGGDVQLDRDVLAGAGHQRHAFDAHRLEAVEGDRNGVDARGDLGEAESAMLLGRRAAGAADERRTGDLDARAGYRCAGVVGHRAGERCRRLALGPCAAREERRAEDPSERPAASTCRHAILPFSMRSECEFAEIPLAPEASARVLPTRSLQCTCGAE